MNEKKIRGGVKGTGKVVLFVLILLIFITCEKPERILQFDTLVAEAADITFNTALLKGEITDLGSKAIEQHGLLLSESSVPALGQQNTDEEPLGTINKKGKFQFQFTGLKANTRYYFRAFVVVDGSPEYASIKDFTTPDSQLPVVTAGTVSGLTMTSASLNGEVTSDGGEPATVRGLCWGLSANPTFATSLDTTKNGTGAGTFTGNMTGLTPGTQYYARTYATNSKGTVYSTEVPFKTHSLPVVSTSPVTNISATGATSGGEVADDGGTDVTARGICWSTTTGPTTALATKTSDGTGEGVFTSAITGLTSGSTYFVRAYATNQFGTSYGAELSFTASSTILPPAAETNSATPVGTTTATLNGSVNANGLSSTVTFEYGTTASYGQTATASQSPVTGNTATPVSVSLTGLSPSATYHFRVKAVSTGGTAYGDDVIFTTTSNLPTVSDYDGNTYNIVTIGTQEWMQSNLMTEHYSNGDAVPLVSDVLEWSSTIAGAMCYYNDDEAAYKNPYGGFYNWYAITDVRNVCPAGWHAPDNSEWTTLNDYLGGESVSGGKLKESGIAHWASPNSGATNETGFTGLPGGYRAYNGGSGYMAMYGYWWAVTLSSATEVYYNFLSHDNSAVSKLGGSKNYGFSVRCIKGPRPLAETTGASSLASTSSTLNGRVNPNSASTVVTFEYGTTTSYGQTVTATQSPSAGSLPVNVSANVTGLLASNTYHYRVKAVNAGGTTYGDDATFTTQDALPTVSDYDGNSYNIISVSTQEWMQKNLMVTHYSNGDAIPNVTANAAWAGLTTGAYIWYSNDASSYKSTYGALYNWYAVSDIRNVCPTGWHVPGDDEWNYLGGLADAGGKMKEEGLAHWVSPNSGATNETGFTALPAGEREADGNNFSALGYSNFLWSSTPWDPSYSWARAIFNNSSNLLRQYYNNKYGYSVRCIKGAIPLASTGSATDSDPYSSTLNGSVNPNGLSTDVSFEYGLTSTYGTTAAATPGTVTASGVSAVSAAIAGLDAQATYHYRIKAVNSAGTTYGEDRTFTTSPAPVSDADGNEYRTVLIGSQLWMQENLRTTLFSNGDAVPNVTDNTAWSGLTTGAYAWYNNNISNKDPYGALYNFHAVSDVRNICPVGWHVPTYDEMYLLSPVGSCGLKEAGTSHWLMDDPCATNSSGFTALPSGVRIEDGSFSNLGTSFQMWSSTDNEGVNMWYAGITGTLGLGYSATGPKYGMSVRCLKGELPLAETSAATAVASTSVTLHGKVNPNGASATVTFEYGTTTFYGLTAPASPDPGSGTTPVDVSASLTSLTPGTTYHFRVKAVNSGGTTYGRDLTFTTPSQLSDTDGNTYNAVIIGTQTWLSENLKTTKLNDNTIIPEVTNNTTWSGLTTAAYCWYNNDKSTYGDVYGALYNWYAVNTGKLCPAGWHVPSDDEWTTLENYLIANNYNYDGSVTGNKIAKALSSSSFWNASSVDGSPGNADYPEKRNITGWTGLPGGYRYASNSSSYVGDFGRWKSTTTYLTAYSWIRQLSYNGSALNRTYGDKTTGDYVRCLKD